MRWCPWRSSAASSAKWWRLGSSSRQPNLITTARSRSGRAATPTESPKEYVEMTPEQIADIRRTWAMVTPIADQAAVLFYDRLFAIDPATKPLFRRTDMVAQRATLMGTLALVVKGVDELDRLVPIVENLGRRH